MSGKIAGHSVAPLAIVVMGVSGSGKSTLGAALAARLDCPFLEGDGFHSAANVAKMREGIALTDADRWPWLDHLGAAMGQAVRQGGVVVAACSALKRAYRERLATAAAEPIAFALLDAPLAELARRMGNRPGHYMPPSLLDSQLDTLERPGADEPALTLDSTQGQDRLADAILAWIAQRLAA
ncbi:gluconokinase [Novosphingobium sp. GV055]|nr:gluconokinase [Novosphingobium sp. GV055]PUB02498.1 gluconokinase [Novosphingobium sp. GV061]PUB19443.1 gluconokinase [Novosphingobium sp. GV079]PUB40867.1 gluconokinase [Novosphingobium sp. GV027]